MGREVRGEGMGTEDIGDGKQRGEGGRCGEMETVMGN